MAKLRPAGHNKEQERSAQAVEAGKSISFPEASMSAEPRKLLNCHGL